ncbi:MAG TPA: peptidylprolyl isomerase [Thermoleophilaceae bacterium]
MRHLALMLTLVLVPLAAAGCGSSKSGTSSSAAASAPSTASAPASTQATASNGCTTEKAPPARKAGGESKPKGKLDPKKTYTVTVQTNCGTFAFKLDVKDSPDTTAAFAGLVKRGFFNGLIFHRIVPGFVIQGGDPAGTGEGGPGFSTVDPPPKSADYKLGTVAMAKTQTEPAGAAGSQFFVVTGQDAQLPPEYALLGHVTSGIDVVQRIGKLGNPTDPNGTPTQTVVMKKVTVSSG